MKQRQNTTLCGWKRACKGFFDERGASSGGHSTAKRVSTLSVNDRRHNSLQFASKRMCRDFKGFNNGGPPATGWQWSTGDGGSSGGGQQKSTFNWLLVCERFHGGQERRDTGRMSFIQAMGALISIQSGFVKSRRAIGPRALQTSHWFVSKMRRLRSGKISEFVSVCVEDEQVL
ncbi:hypothetical protein Cgig2_018737 [Carnegiea gigantea]|uniref:Uncharacterized protein n=1 Tax=Carnegiea gigantea TaxID=171969 RepID=A0A9Q1GUU2_9CARY|nr:hypothetical protein Cgig2_018737 [Carnegiea gigantea]